MVSRESRAMAEFCAEQRDAFDARAWLSCSAANRVAVAATAKYLSMTSWYGYADELERIAEELSMRGGHCGPEALCGCLDLADFSAMTRYQIALRRRGSAESATCAGAAVPLDRPAWVHAPGSSAPGP